MFNSYFTTHSEIVDFSLKYEFTFKLLDSKKTDALDCKRFNKKILSIFPDLMLIVKNKNLDEYKARLALR